MSQALPSASDCPQPSQHSRSSIAIYPPVVPHSSIRGLPHHRREQALIHTATRSGPSAHTDGAGLWLCTLAASTCLRSTLVTSGGVSEPHRAEASAPGDDRRRGHV